MYIVTVMVCKSGIAHEELTYKSSIACTMGDLIQVSFRNKDELGVVLSVATLAAARLQLRTAPYQVKNVIRVVRARYVHEKVITACAVMASVCNTTVAAMLTTIISLPQVRLHNRLPSYRNSLVSENSSAVSSCVAQPYVDRLNTYAKKITPVQCFVPAIIIVPTEAHATRVARDLQQLVSSDVYCCAVSKKGISVVQQKILSTQHRVVYCITASQLAQYVQVLPGYFIYESENHPLSVASRAPYVDYRLLVKCIAEITAVPLLFGDFPCSTMVHTLFGAQRESSDYCALLPGEVFSVYTPEVDVRIRDSALLSASKKKDFQVFLPVLREDMQKLFREGRSVFIVASRHGYSSSIICNDCAMIMQCGMCGGTLTIKSELIGTKKYFMCHECRAQYEAFDVCPTCKGLNLVSLGIGIERIAEEIVRHIPARAIYVRSERSGQLKNMQTGEVFTTESLHPVICIGTIYDLDIQEKIFDHTVVVSHEGMLAAPVVNLFDYEEFITKTTRDHTMQCIHVQVQHAQTNIESYKGTTFRERACQYIANAYELGIAPTPCVHCIITASPEILERFMATIISATHDDQIVFDGLRPVFDYRKTKVGRIKSVQGVFSGFKDFDHIVAWTARVYALAGQEVFVQCIPYPTKLQYSFRLW